MQPFAAAPRDALTSAQVVRLIRDDPATGMGFGGELIARDLSVIADISSVLTTGSVTRSSYADLHGSAVLAIADELDWGSALVRPYVTLSNAVYTARFNLGAYFLSTPKTAYGTRPRVHEVDGIDVLDALRDAVGESYAVAQGVGYLATVETILGALGYPAGAYVIDQSAAAQTLPSARAWLLDESTSWLTIVNDLLAAVGYQGVWSDWDGRLRLQPYMSPSSRAPEWTYDTGPTTSMLAPSRSVERDLYSAPNRWVFYRSNNIEAEPPVEGNGLYTFVNQSNGPASVDARGGRVKTRVVPLDVADHAALVQTAQVTVDADMRITARAEISTWPNPLHWHFDRVELQDPEIGPTVQALVTRWTLPFDGRAMTHEWSLL